MDLDNLEIIVIFVQLKLFPILLFDITNYEDKTIDAIVKSIDSVHLLIVC